ncbi:hypothetical protein [Chryseobacterium camelliae]|uniref:hypothetical protein n=1 Tax=Chryseobacterium camelliae TaxID=1265445 RepID=UPI0028577948|nr:hypothetical protein [Chryseobacterium camelliae]MDR6513736.1 hypothetical protein [Chryseobacterium camelliae]
MDTLVQILILICLIMVIILLLLDKVKIIRSNQKMGPAKETFLPDVIGDVSNPMKEKTPVWLAKRKKLVEQLGSTTEEPVKISSAEDESALEDTPDADLMEIDEEGTVPTDDESFGQAVSLDELTKVGNLLQRDWLDVAEEKETTDIIQKLEGTEFLTMMQQSIDGASQKIAMLLDRSHSASIHVRSQAAENDTLDNFDIGDFI